MEFLIVLAFSIAKNNTYTEKFLNTNIRQFNYYKASIHITNTWGCQRTLP